MNCVGESEWNKTIAHFYDEKSKIIWATGSNTNIAFHGHERYIVLGINLELMFLSDKAQLYYFLKEFQPTTFIDQSTDNYSFQGGWFEKPVRGSRSYGINYITNIQYWKNEDHILQKEIVTPLINNRKFDIRIWAALCKNRKFWIAESCLVRVCKNVGDQITNTSLFLNEQDKSTHFNFIDSSLSIYEKCKQKLIEICVAIQNRLDNLMTNEMHDHFWNLFGFDLIMDCDQKVWLLEINNKPNTEPVFPEFQSVYIEWFQQLIHHCQTEFMIQ